MSKYYNPSNTKYNYINKQAISKFYIVTLQNKEPFKKNTPSSYKHKF